MWQKGDKNGPVVNGLSKGEIDFGGTPSTITLERLNLAIIPVYPAIPFRLVKSNSKDSMSNDFIKFYCRSFFLFRSTSLIRSISLHEIFSPMHSSIWYLIIILAIVSTMVLIFLSYHTPAGVFERCVRSFFIIVGAFCQQGK